MSDQRDAGRRLVFSTIRKDGPIARVDLARATGISPATVTAITAELIREGLIEEGGPRQERTDLRRGRPRVDLRVRGAARLVAGMKISHQAVTVAVLDFAGLQIGDAEVTLQQEKYQADDLAEVLRDALTQAAAAAGIGLGDLSGVGIGISGVVDAGRGFVYWSASLAERNVALRDIIARRIDLPIFLDNDANLIAIAEQLFGEGRGVRDFIVVTIESGVGMGIVIGDELYRGTRGCGAEFGHTKVHLDGALCRCGQRGCLEAYVADYALLREAAVSTDFSDARTAAAKMQALDKAARDGDETARLILRRAGRMFALGLANIANVFDPELIILSGERMQYDHLYTDEVIDYFRKSIVQIDTPPPEVRIHKWGDLMWAKGAAAYAIDGVADIALREISENAA